MTEKHLTLHFENASAMCLYNWEMSGQLSDGKYENSRPFDHWKWICEIVNMIVDGKKGIEGHSWNRGMYQFGKYRKKYNLNEWFSKYIKGWRKDGIDRYMWATRIIAYGKFGKIYPELTYEQMSNIHGVEILLESLQMQIEQGEKNPEVLFNKVTDFSTCQWREEYYNRCKDYFTKEFVKKFVELNYDIKECKVDVKSMEDSINSIYGYVPEKLY